MHINKEEKTTTIVNNKRKIVSNFQQLIAFLQLHWEGQRERERHEKSEYLFYKKKIIKHANGWWWWDGVIRLLKLQWVWQLLTLMEDGGGVSTACIGDR